MRLVNRTPHTVNIIGEGFELSIPGPDDPKDAARVAVEFEPAEGCGGAPTAYETFGEVYGLPAPHEGEVYIVSRVVAAAASDRKDLLVPGSPVRGEAGKIIGVAQLVWANR